MTNENDVRTTAEQFYTAATAVLHGDAEPMLAVWSNSEEASYCDTRGEIVRGWPEARTVLEAGRRDQRRFTRPTHRDQSDHSLSRER